MRFLTFRHSVFLFCLLGYANLSADPWGKDACLVDYRPCQEPCEPQQSPMATIGEVLIRFHQEVISPADGPRSHFFPSSSQYTKIAMKRHGFYWGWILGCDRLMRENSEKWIYPTVPGPYGCLKYDPVPN